MLKAGTLRRWCLGLSLAWVVVAGPVVADPAVGPNLDFSRPAARSGQNALVTAAEDAAAEFRDILALVDLLEEHLPKNHALVTQLRGKLYQHERRQLQQAFELSSSLRASGPGDAPRARRGDDRREPLPGSDLYSTCAGLRDHALVAQLREIVSGHTSIDYTAARRQIFTQLDNHGGEVECVYTGRKGRYNNIPSDRDMNTEHSWPQSKGATGVAKSDLFHLFPTDSQSNSTRGSLPFGNVSNPEWAEGGSKCDGDVFEVRREHRGNVARALFYFATRYGKSIASGEEATLRAWHKEDPVDAAERERCDKIENIQHNRNPYIDRPELVDQISDF